MMRIKGPCSAAVKFSAAGGRKEEKKILIQTQRIQMTKKIIQVFDKRGKLVGGMLVSSTFPSLECRIRVTLSFKFLSDHLPAPQM